MNEPLRGVVLCSGSASSFRFLHAHDPNFGKSYTIVGVFSDVPEVKGIEYAKELNIPTRVLDFREWRKKYQVAYNDLRTREVYFAQVLFLLAQWNPDFIICSGFMLIVTNPLLDAFKGRILNVHPAFLSILDVEGKRKYRGLNVVKRAMYAGDPTGSCVHIINEEPDGGPIVAESVALPYVAGDDPAAHQDRMKVECDGPAFQAALEKLIRSGWPRVPWRSQ